MTNPLENVSNAEFAIIYSMTRNNAFTLGALFNILKKVDGENEWLGSLEEEFENTLDFLESLNEFIDSRSADSDG